MRKDGDTTIIEDSDLEPITKEEFKSIIEPVVDALMSLTKIAIELTAAGKEVDDEGFRQASSRAFEEIGRTIGAIKHTGEMINTLDLVAPGEETPNE
ncbi:hypothetical protein P3W55_13715 [Pseudomonas citronellolis]|uniref:Uncharacterized protein n=1 Tax=Pseudomonas citronellolis TaxID=53408 RepID=A0AAW6P6T4_9PSED|nr:MULTISPECIES: hypothetical protein [Pseudomonas]MDF3842769.1 hypothetical protein [Pseudomonas citronellolis]